MQNFSTLCHYLKCSITVFYSVKSCHVNHCCMGQWSKQCKSEKISATVFLLETLSWGKNIDICICHNLCFIGFNIPYSYFICYISHQECMQWYMKTCMILLFAYTMHVFMEWHRIHARKTTRIWYKIFTTYPPILPTHAKKHSHIPSGKKQIYAIWNTIFLCVSLSLGYLQVAILNLMTVGHGSSAHFKGWQ